MDVVTPKEQSVPMCCTGLLALPGMLETQLLEETAFKMG